MPYTARIHVRRTTDGHHGPSFGAGFLEASSTRETAGRSRARWNHPRSTTRFALHERLNEVLSASRALLKVADELRSVAHEKLRPT